MAKSVFMPGLVDDVNPACMPDLNGLVHLRGHISLSPVPAVGGSMLGILPMDQFGVCSCSPIPDPNAYDNTIIISTTGVAYPRDRPNIPDVCMVRVMISMYIPPDVNRDFVIDQADIGMVEMSKYYNMDVSLPSKCPLVKDKYDCGAADVNRDGYVNMLDTTAITQSARLGTNVSCGAIYATGFSCGSSRSAPLTPSVDISFDSITYYNNNGEFGVETSLGKRAAGPDGSLLSDILVEVEHLNAKVEEKFGAVHSKLSTVESTLKTHSSWMKGLRGTLPAEQRNIVIGVSLVAGAIVLCAAIVHQFVKRR
jgi:hypothetical protein